MCVVGPGLDCRMTTVVGMCHLMENSHGLVLFPCLRMHQGGSPRVPTAYQLPLGEVLVPTAMNQRGYPSHRQSEQQGKPPIWLCMGQGGGLAFYNRDRFPEYSPVCQRVPELDLQCRTSKRESLHQGPYLALRESPGREKDEDRARKWVGRLRVAAGRGPGEDLKEDDFFF